MRSSIIILGVITLLNMSCLRKGEIEVQNDVRNVRLENINWGDVPITYSLLPGEKSKKVTIEDYKESFPKYNQLEFYMISGSNTVYLKTKNTYELDYDETLSIIITDSTEVINPMLQ